MLLTSNLRANLLMVEKSELIKHGDPTKPWLSQYFGNLHFFITSRAFLVQMTF